jgi:hypothetical protein
MRLGVASCPRVRRCERRALGFPFEPIRCAHCNRADAGRLVRANGPSAYMRRLPFIASLFVESATGVDCRSLRSHGRSLSYYALFSLFPLTLLSVTALGFVLGDDPGTRNGS